MSTGEDKKELYELLDSVYFSLKDPEEFVYLIRQLCFIDAETWEKVVYRWLRTVKDNDD